MDRSTLKLNRIYARHLASNTASGRVLAKLGMRQEGVLREFAPKGQGFEDAVLLSLLRREWDEGNEGGRMKNSVISTRATLTQGMQKEECRMQKFGSKPPRGYPEATPRPSGSQPVGPLKPPCSHPEATLRLTSGYLQAPAPRSHSRLAPTAILVRAQRLEHGTDARDFVRAEQVGLAQCGQHSEERFGATHFLTEILEGMGQGVADRIAQCA